jgi:glycogen synthase
MSSLYRGSSIDASYKVSVHLAKRFRRRFKKKKKMQDTGHCPESKKTFLFFNNSIAVHSKIMDTVANTSSSFVDTVWREKTRSF